MTKLRSVELMERGLAEMRAQIAEEKTMTVIKVSLNFYAVTDEMGGIWAVAKRQGVWMLVNPSNELAGTFDSSDAAIGAIK